MTTLPTTSDRALALDAAAIGVVSVAVCVAPRELVFMSVLVPAVIALRLLAWSHLPRAERGSVAAELALMALCTALGAFNDWNSVVVHRVYDYTVPHGLERLAGPDALPVWMLLFWGLILRALVSLFGWHRLGDPSARDLVWLAGRTVRSAWLKIALQLMLVLVTRQLLYRTFDDPWLSWPPFAVALGLGLLLFKPNWRTARLLGIFAVVGPGIEVLYIQVGGLHRYHHGVLLGVPVWIALWWLLAVLIWDDLSARIRRRLGRLSPQRPPG